MIPSQNGVVAYSSRTDALFGQDSGPPRLLWTRVMEIRK